MDEGASSSCWDFPTDVLVEILRRLTPNARRRFRQVCRQWRDTIDTRAATDMRRRTKSVVVTTHGSTYVVDLQSPGQSRELWRKMGFRTAKRYKAMAIVNTCNGLVCLCDDTVAGGGAITVANPATGETLAVPPLPVPPRAGAASPLKFWSRSWHQTYDFAYHPLTGRYKVVHVPCRVDMSWGIGTAQVFTLGEAAWRCVSTTGGTDDVDADIDTRCGIGPRRLANVDGTAYWLTGDVGEVKIMSMDLKDERVVTPTEPLPVMASTSCFLTKVHGRLAVVGDEDGSITVWVLEGERWTVKYIVETRRLRQQESLLGRELALPHFAAGDYILTHKQAYNSVLGEKCVLYGHRTESNAARLHSHHGFVAQIGCKDHGEVVQDFLGWMRWTFAYVETEEPLGVYNLDSVTGGGSPGGS